ncbi:uncharacterized protein LOC125008494 isoform X2 [Mugil cephalus]|uniref:uncharacterized protein LOC125008494 isoform X2 n=1 Tax=Mugil cephalus TaxID=48193 RepID=UPI001FB6CEA7|nr:uncharacterized protein LOC125008494 isoform X2 [Mugil cephalus]
MDGSLRMLMLCLLLCVSSNGYDVEEYGNTHKIRMPRGSHYVLFKRSESSDVKILWQRDQPEAAVDSRQTVIGKYFVMRNLTQRDGGEYMIKDKNQHIILHKTVEVNARNQDFTLLMGDTFQFSYDLDSSACNIYFLKENEEYHIVRQGRQYHEMYDCPGYEFIKPCGILSESVQMSCNGLFVVKDNNGDDILEVNLTVEFSASLFDGSYLGYGGVAAVVAVLGCCLKHFCCCKSSKEGSSQSPAASASAAAEPSMHYQKYDQGPVGRRTNQLSQPFERMNPARPTSGPTAPLVSSQAEQDGAPAGPFFSGPEPKFELKGVTFVSPLSSDSGYSDVYRSDKLNFLSQP